MTNWVGVKWLNKLSRGCGQCAPSLYYHVNTQNKQANKNTNTQKNTSPKYLLMWVIPILMH